MRNLLALTCAGLVIVFGGMVVSQRTSQRPHSNPVLSAYGQAPTDPSAATASPMVTTTFQPTGTATAVNTAGWTTYTNSIVGFSIAYPSTMQLETYRHIADNQSLDPIFLCDYATLNTSLVICFYLPQGINPNDTAADFTRASLAVSTSNLDQQDCLSLADYRLDAARSSMFHESINGISFYTLQTRDERTEVGEGSTNLRSRTFVCDTCIELTHKRALARRKLPGFNPCR